MNTALWIVAGLLAVLALFGGLSKTFMPKDKLDELGAKSGGGWTEYASAGFVRSLGVLELLAAVGFVLPAVLDIAPVVVPVTAVCWVLLMVGAMFTHARYGQYRFVALNLVYLAAAAFVAWGRFGPESFTG